MPKGRELKDWEDELFGRQFDVWISPMAGENLNVNTRTKWGNEKSCQIKRAVKTEEGESEGGNDEQDKRGFRGTTCLIA
jgi:hypothetical protein